MWNVLAAQLAIEAVTAAVQGMMSNMPIRWIR
jgi:hypothetical protein